MADLSIDKEYATNPHHPIKHKTMSEVNQELLSYFKCMGITFNIANVEAYLTHNGYSSEEIETYYQLYLYRRWKLL